ncbi:MAG: aminotransferase class IV [Saprospiraceae bacterium]
MKFIETIQIKNRQFQNIHFHNQRLNLTRQNALNQTDNWQLQQLISIPETLTDSVYKCRVIYAHDIQSIEFSSYQIRPIHSLKAIHNNSIDYHYKYLNRDLLQHLFEQRGDCDDILIIKNGLITDSYYCNLAFFYKKNWYTPAAPLLKGTQRAALIEKGIIQEKNILIDDLHIFSKVRLFNAMIEWKNAPEIPIGQVFS